jgi:hypothetical protein
MTKFIYLLMLGFGFCSYSAAQPLLEDISIGISGRTEQNIYRYYNNQGIGNFNTLRVSNGYSAGLTMHSSVNYLFSAGIGVNLAEASYRPDLEKNGSVLWSNQLRLWQFDFWGELKLSQNEKSHPMLMLGGQMMFVDYKRELYSKPGDADVYSWPQQRFMPKIGLSYYQEIGKKWQLIPNIGFRLALANKVGYDYVFNQFFAGVNLTYRLKSW